MAKIVVSSLARNDLIEILRDLSAKAGKDVAARYGALFDRLYVRLSAYPESGSPRSFLGVSVRMSLVLPYMVLYEYDTASDTAVVLRLLHGRRKITGSMLASRIAPPS